MICKDLFKDRDVVYVRSYSSTRKEIEQYAKNNGLKIRITVGIWVNNPETETVFKVELLGRNNSKISEAKKKRNKKIEMYKKLLDEGKSQSEIAKILGITREAVSRFIIYHNIKGDKTDELHF